MKAGSLGSLSIHLSVCLGDVFFLVEALKRCFDLSTTVYLSGRHLSIKMRETGSLFRVWHT